MIQIQKPMKIEQIFCSNHDVLTKHSLFPFNETHNHTRMIFILLFSQVAKCIISRDFWLLAIESNSNSKADVRPFEKERREKSVPFILYQCTYNCFHSDCETPTISFVSQFFHEWHLINSYPEPKFANIPMQTEAKSQVPLWGEESIPGTESGNEQQSYIGWRAGTTTLCLLGIQPPIAGLNLPTLDQLREPQSNKYIHNIEDKPLICFILNFLGKNSKAFYCRFAPLNLS